MSNWYIFVCPLSEVVLISEGPLSEVPLYYKLHTEFILWSNAAALILSLTGTKWDWFVESKGMSWAFMLHTWLSQNTTSIHIVQYEHLVVDLRGELVKMLNFLNLEVPDEIIDCVVENSEGKFRRERHLNFDPFTSENREAVNRLVRQAAPLLASHGIKYNTR